MTQLLPVLYLVIGSVLLIAQVVLIVRVDQYWRRRRQNCPGCLHRWVGTTKTCPKCGSRGEISPPPEKIKIGKET